MYKVDLNFFLKGKLFFSDEYLCLLELVVQLSDWKNKMRNINCISSFGYYTMEYDEDNIFEFIYDDQSDRWYIQSIWKLFDCVDSISTAVLFDQVEKLINDLEKDLHYTYGIQLRWFLKSYG
jgi:hypothetical protein